MRPADIDKILVDDWSLDSDPPESSQDGGRSRPEASIQELNRLIDCAGPPGMP